MLGIVKDHCRFVVVQEVKSPLQVFVRTKQDKVGQGGSDVGTLIVRAVMGHDTEAAKPRQHIGYISPNRTQATKATLSDPYNEGYESILHVFDQQHLVATVHTTQPLPRPTTSSQRAEFVPHNTHNTRAHPDASSDAPDANETPRANL